MTNCYTVLGLAPGASTNEIRQAYRRLALKWHPDKNPNNVEEATRRFKEISEAYEMLSDETRRKSYDAEVGSSHHPFSSRPRFTFRSPNDVFAEFFRDFESSFGGSFFNSEFDPFDSIFRNENMFNREGGVSNYSSTVTQIQNGHSVTTRINVRDGVEIKEVYENNQLVSRTERPVSSGNSITFIQETNVPKLDFGRNNRRN